MNRLILIALLIWPVFAQAQSWPVHENTYVNDYANVIDDEAEVRITRTLQALREETGVEATVLTIFTRSGYEIAGSLEEFSTGLFNNWGIGNPDKNDGILILVVSEDREMRIELGSGYPSEFNREAQDIIDFNILPAFKDDRMSDGIEEGTDVALTHIARAFAAGDAPPTRSNGGNGGGLIGAIMGIIVAAGFALVFGRKIKNRFKRCPQCGKREIHQKREVLELATTKDEGAGETVTTCSNCDYRDSRSYIIPMVTPFSSNSSSGGSFGGGGSSGGGASGRW